MISSGNIRVLILMNILITIIFVPATADVIFPAKTFGFKIANTEDFPDYYIIVKSAGGVFQILSQDVYVSEFSNPMVYAVRKTDFNASGISHAIPSHQFREFFSNGPLASITGVYETYRIASINTTSFNLVRTERIFRYDNGSEISVWTDDPVYHHVDPWETYSPAVTTVKRGDVPTTVTHTPIATSITGTSIPVTGNDQDTNNENPLMMYQYFLLPLIALFMIVVILFRRHNQ
jgi:hypothetical protein